MQSTAERAASAHRAFAVRTLTLFAVCVAGYVLTLLVVYPKFFAPFAAFHADMYTPADIAARGKPLAELLTMSRPVVWLIAAVAGRLGFEGSLVFFAALMLLALALCVATAERYLLCAKMPWWIALATVTFAMSGPAFYFVPGYDNNTSVAMLFFLLGIVCWESRVNARTAFIGTAICFCLSTLSKESFIPAMALYAAVAAYHARTSRRIALATLALPLVAVCAALLDIQVMGSQYVTFNAGSSDNYRIGLEPASLMKAFWFYVAPLANVWVVAFIAVCGFGIWRQGRWRAGVFVLALALTTYVPYLLLPNHLQGYYSWAPLPALMLLIPLAWVDAPAQAHGGPRPGQRRSVALVTRGVLAVSYVFALMAFSKINSDGSTWSIQQQNINRSLLESVRAVRPQLAASRSVLVCGLSYPFHPWHHGEFLAADLPPGGMWTVAIEPAATAIGPQPHAQPIAYDRIRWNDYDLILVFDAGGKLAGAYRPAQLETLAGKLHLPRGDARALVAAVREGKGA
jgi:hypothetical protein